MADMESYAAGGTKRKHTENAFTAKAESGTLKVKILRRDQRPADNVVDALSSSTSSTTSSSTSNKTRSRRAVRQPQPTSSSPPKPRPNRKHVPIFYEPQFRQPIKRAGSHSSSTDESATQSMSSTGIHSTSSTEVSAAASTSSTTSSFVSQLAEVRLQSASSSGGDVGPPPRTNPLFVRNDSDGLGTLGELLRPYFPSGSSGLQPSFPLGGTLPTGTTSSSAGLLVDQTVGLSSALHQLASSSASYRSALDALSTRTHVPPSTSSSADETGTSTSAPSSSTTTVTMSSTSDTTHNGTKGGLENYRFDPFAALQTAIDHARRVSSTNGSTNQDNDKHREIGSPNSNARFYRLEPSGFSGTTHNNGNTSTATSLGSPPELPPAFTLQNSLVGGGIQRLTPSKPLVEADGNKDATSSASTDAKDAIAALGPPPDSLPTFLLQNSLTGGGISLLNLPKTHPSLDRLGSLTSLISQANETAKDLNTALTSPPKTHLSLDRLVSLTSVTSEDGETAKSMNLTVSHSAASAPQATCISASLSTTHDTEGSNNGAIDLGPPPSGPPAFTIGNSLMGGGIDLQPVAASVNTHNFDWKLHRAASSSGGDVASSPAATREISHVLRARLERSLASSQNSADKS